MLTNIKSSVWLIKYVSKAFNLQLTVCLSSTLKVFSGYSFLALLKWPIKVSKNAIEVVSITFKSLKSFDGLRVLSEPEENCSVTRWLDYKYVQYLAIYQEQ